MKTYDVHLYAVVRVPVCGIEADNPEAASLEAERRADLHNLLDCARFEYTEDINYTLVAELDEDGEHAMEYHYSGRGELLFTVLGDNHTQEETT